ncbi:hypothetical protein J2W28_000944 [Variovorax boronicumulans]|nr:hypothetical protein [Variovorax boronicumulans]MDQ0001811.1 hypothetical protein [Variovorax boronicumulans]
MKIQQILHPFPALFNSPAIDSLPVTGWALEYKLQSAAFILSENPFSL